MATTTFSHNGSLSDPISGDVISEILVRLKGDTFFGVDFYCIFGRFAEMNPINKSEILGRLEPHGPHC